MVRRTRYLILAGLLALATSAGALANDVAHRAVTGSFAEVFDGVRSAIEGQGLNITSVLEAGDMLQRTGPAFGYETKVYARARTIQFCSAKLSHRFVRLDPNNLVLCPFAITIYTLAGDESNVHVSYRLPDGGPGAEAIVRDVVTLIEAILDEALW